MNQEADGRLRDGGSYRATSYLVELTDAAGGQRQVIDLNNLRSVQRTDRTVRLRLAKSGHADIEAASLDDAGRLEATLRAALAERRGTNRGRVVGLAAAAGVFAAIIVAATLGVVYLIVRGADNGGAKEVHARLKEGSTASISRAGYKENLTIIQLKDNAVSTNLFEQPQSGMRYWAAEIQIENDSPGDVLAGGWKLRTSNDLEYDRSMVGSVGKNLDLILTLTAGGKVQGYVVFQIPKDVQPKFLRYQAIPFGNDFVYFDH